MDLSAYLQQARIRLGAPDTFDYAGRAIRSACNLHVLRTRAERAEELRKTIQTAKDGSQNVARGYGEVPPYYDLNAWREIEADTDAISSGQALPSYAVREPSTVAGAWRSFREHVLYYNAGWDPWIDWLEFRLFGHQTEAFAEAQWRSIELKLATAGDSLWSDPLQINAFLAQAIQEIRSIDFDEDNEIEAQNPNAILFVANEAGQFDLDRSPIAQGLPSTSDSLYLEALETAGEVISENTENSAAFLRHRAQRYRSALLNLHEASGPAVLIVRGESLRLLKQAYDVSTDPLDLPPLTEQARMRLDELVAQHNVLVGLHAGLASVDRLLQPDLNEELLSTGDLRRMIDEAREQNVLTADAESALVEVADQASSTGATKRLYVVRASESGKNLIRGALRELLKYKRAIGVAAVGVPPALYAVGRWALANEAILTRYFQGNPGMHEAVVQIFQWLHALPLL